MTVNSAFGKAEVRDSVRQFHDRAVEQQRAAREKALLLQRDLEDAKQVEAALRTALTAQQRDTGFTFTISWTGLAEGSTVISSSLLEVAITGAGLEFVTGPHPLVRIEIGGWPVAIDPAGWWVDGQGTLRGQFAVIADSWLGAPHPFVGEGVVDIPPQAAAQIATSDDMASPELLAVRAVAQQQAAALSPDPAEFLTRPADPGVSSVAATVSAEQFLPSALRDATLQQRRFPAVLALDRPAAAPHSRPISGPVASRVAARWRAWLAAIPGRNAAATWPGWPNSATAACAAAAGASPARRCASVASSSPLRSSAAIPARARAGPGSAAVTCVR
jgi:hypothetical protein